LQALIQVAVVSQQFLLKKNLQQLIHVVKNQQKQRHRAIAITPLPMAKDQFPLTKIAARANRLYLLVMLKSIHSSCQVIRRITIKSQ